VKDALEMLISDSEEGVSTTVLEEEPGSSTLPYIEKISAENKRGIYALVKKRLRYLFFIDLFWWRRPGSVETNFGGSGFGLEKILKEKNLWKNPARFNLGNLPVSCCM
jgi:hypothetical protein